MRRYTHTLGPSPPKCTENNQPTTIRQPYSRTYGPIRQYDNWLPPLSANPIGSQSAGRICVRYLPLPLPLTKNSCLCVRLPPLRRFGYSGPTGFFTIDIYGYIFLIQAIDYLKNQFIRVLWSKTSSCKFVSILIRSLRSVCVVFCLFGIKFKLSVSNIWYLGVSTTDKRQNEIH